MRACYIVWRFIEALASATSKLWNATRYGGSTHQSVSARAFIDGTSDPEWAARRDKIDRFFAFFGKPGHCREAWDYEVNNAITTLERNGLITEAP